MRDSIPRVSISRTTRAYSQLRHRLARLGPHLVKLTWLRRAVSRLDNVVLPSDPVLVQSANGWHIWVDPQDKAVARAIIATGSWQRDEADLLAALLPAGGTAVDVGANVGFMTGVLAHRAGPDGTVHAFEPDSRNFGLLERTVAENGWAQAHVYHAGCADVPARMTLFRDSRNRGNHSLTRDRLHDGEVEEVDVVRLDEALAELERLDVMKVDVQGWELQVLRGSSGLAHLRPVLLTELYPRGLRLAGTDPEQMWAELSKWGRILHWDAAHGCRPISLDEAWGAEDDTFRNVDLVVCPEEKIELLKEIPRT